MPENPIQPVDRATVISITRLPRPGGPTVLDMLDWVSLLMDRLFQVPGTQVRFGLNSIFLLIPILGDIIPTMISVAILMIGLRHYRVPRIVAARMVFNSALDAALGWIPVFGDLFNMWFKADTRNVRLLMQYASGDAEHPPSTWQHWLFIVGMLAGLVVFLVLLVLGVTHLVGLLFGPSTPAE
jgi:hypothetical protein